MAERSLTTKITDPCCRNIKEASEDDVIGSHPHLGTCIRLKNTTAELIDSPPRMNVTTTDSVVPIRFCPWCGKEQPQKLANAPFMNYRP